MSDVSDMAALLAALPDEDLRSVVASATTGRPGLEQLHLAAVQLSAQGGHAGREPDVTCATGSGGASAVHPAPTSSDQVGPVSGLPLPSTGIAEPGGWSDSGVPTFESVRDKVERRVGTAQGMDELDRQTPVGASVQEQWQARAKSARERLDEIRKSMHRNDSD